MSAVVEFTELLEYPITAGTLTEWIPSVGPHASTPEDAGWCHDDRPTSHVHEAHLRRTIADPSAGRESWLGTAFELHGELDRAAFRRAVLAWIDRHEAMRSNAVVDTGTGSLSRVTAAPGATDLWEIRQDECEQSTEVHEHLQHLFDEYTSPLAWPSYAFVTLEPPADAGSDRVTVFFAADHSIIDGLSIVLIAHELTRLYEEQTTGVPAALFPTGSYLDFGELERTLCSGLDASHAAAVEWDAFLRDCGGRFPSFPLDIGPDSGRRVQQSGLSEWILTAEQTDAVTLACRSQAPGGSPGLPAGLTAALGVVAAETSGSDRFRTVMPMHTRHDRSWASSLGWFVGIAPVAFDVGDGASFSELVARAGVELARVKHVARIPLDLVAELTGIDDRPRFVVSYMDVRFAPDAANWPAVKARALRSRKYDHDVYLWFHRTPQGLNVAARFPGTTIATAAVHHFVSRVRSVLESIADSGSLDPVHDPESTHLHSETRMSI